MPDKIQEGRKTVRGCVQFYFDLAKRKHTEYHFCKDSILLSLLTIHVKRKLLNDVCSCCVDEVAAEHYNVDAIVHYGHACLSPTPGKLPVCYVLGRMLLSTEHCIAEVSKQITDHTQPVLLLYDTVYHHAVAGK